MIDDEVFDVSRHVVYRAYLEARKDAKRLNKPMPEFESFLFTFLKEEKIDE